MNAKIQPLAGKKYYGTKIELQSGHIIEVWYTLDGVPSRRQLKDWGMTLEKAREDDMMCDSHYESEQGYLIAEAICEAVNQLSFLPSDEFAEPETAKPKRSTTFVELGCPRCGAIIDATLTQIVYE